MNELKQQGKKLLALVELSPSLARDSVFSMHLRIIAMGANSNTLGSYENEYLTSLQFIINRIQESVG